MSEFYEALAGRIKARLGERVTRVSSRCGELNFEVVDKADLVAVCTTLRDEPELSFEQLMDVCGVDYLTYGLGEWTTESATESGFSRGVVREAVILDEADTFDPKRFAVVYHLLSVTHNARLRLKVYTGLENPPIVASVVPVWSSANWFEREAFDLYGILFDGHPDLRRILTDYGFIGHPFRKDFPLIGTAEVRYDTEKGRVMYQPVSIEPRTLVPRVIREDNRYRPELTEHSADG